MVHVMAISKKDGGSASGLNVGSFGPSIPPFATLQAECWVKARDMRCSEALNITGHYKGAKFQIPHEIVK